VPYTTLVGLLPGRTASNWLCGSFVVITATRPGSNWPCPKRSTDRDERGEIASRTFLASIFCLLKAACHSLAAGPSGTGQSGAGWLRQRQHLYAQFQKCDRAIFITPRCNVVHHRCREGQNTAESREIQPKPTSGHILIGGYIFQSIQQSSLLAVIWKVVLEPRTNFTLLGFGAPISLPIQGLPNHAL
jgi:hypothetical protein